MSINTLIPVTNEVLSSRMVAFINQLAHQGHTVECIPCHFGEVYHREISSDAVEAVFEGSIEITTRPIESGEHVVGNDLIPSGIYFEIINLLQFSIDIIQAIVRHIWLYDLQEHVIQNVLNDFVANRSINDGGMPMYPIYARPRFDGHHIESLPLVETTDESQNLRSSFTVNPPPSYASPLFFNGLRIHHPGTIVPRDNHHLPYYSPSSIPNPPSYYPASLVASPSFPAFRDIFGDVETETPIPVGVHHKLPTQLLTLSDDSRYDDEDKSPFTRPASTRQGPLSPNKFDFDLLKDVLVLPGQAFHPTYLHMSQENEPEFQYQAATLAESSSSSDSLTIGSGGKYSGRSFDRSISS